MVAGLFEQVGMHGWESVVAGHAWVVAEHVEQAEPGVWAVDQGQRDGTVEGHDRVGRQVVEQGVEPEDLCPVGVLGGSSFGMHGRDGGLELGGPDWAGGQGGGEQRDALPMPRQGRSTDEIVL